MDSDSSEGSWKNETPSFRPKSRSKPSISGLPYDGAEMMRRYERFNRENPHIYWVNNKSDSDSEPSDCEDLQEFIKISKALLSDSSDSEGIQVRNVLPAHVMQEKEAVPKRAEPKTVVIKSEASQVVQSNKRVACPYCDKIISRRNLNRHITTIHCKFKTEPVETRKAVDPNYICNFTGCGKVFFSGSGFRYHQKTHKGQEIVKTEQSDKPAVKVESVSKEKLKFCSICNIQFDLLKDYQNHLMTHKDHECDICHRKYQRVGDLLGHHTKYHRGLAVPENVLINRQKNDYCLKCGRIFNCLAELRNHEKIHQDDSTALSLEFKIQSANKENDNPEKL